MFLCLIKVLCNRFSLQADTKSSHIKMGMFSNMFLRGISGLSVLFFTTTIAVIRHTVWLINKSTGVSVSFHLATVAVFYLNCD